MVLRDIVIALFVVKLDDRDGVPLAGVAHCACALLDMLVLLGLIIWAIKAISADSIEEFEALPVETGAAAFVKATWTNIIVGCLYLIFHCCSPCIAAAIYDCFGGRIEFLRPECDWVWDGDEWDLHNARIAMD